MLIKICCKIKISPWSIALKVEQPGTHATFLNLDITVKDWVSVYKFLDKRDAFPFFIVHMSYIDSNIPNSIFYSAFGDEFLRIAPSSLLYKDFNEKATELLNRMQSFKCEKALSKIIRRHEKAFANFGKNCDEIFSELHIYIRKLTLNNYIYIII